MKCIVPVILFALLQNSVYSQKIYKTPNHIYLGELNQEPNDSIKSYTLKTNTLYSETNEDLKIFNYYLAKDKIILFSVFANRKSKNLWQLLDSSRIKNIESGRQLNDIYINAINQARYRPYDVLGNIKRQDIIPIVSIDGKYYMPAGFWLVEFFLVSQKATVYPNENAPCIINIASEPITLKAYTDKLKEINTGYRSHFTNPFYFYSPSSVFTHTPSIFRSFDTKFNKQHVYRFYTLNNSMIIADTYNFIRGIDRFAYIPGKGIVGGSFDFYFCRYGVTPDYARQVMDEAIMMAEELKEK